eukprot:TRINITY_DN8505_c0_g2_i4.p1 TRINITY_DN8505_c0_g2~~TRINITY_DN8505_c0_g2_i4.p1  ORF type:complete len:122 (-),score=8.64 TRINITY_DN8505_c0_g2_i4:93-458(-)
MDAESFIFKDKGLSSRLVLMFSSPPPGKPNPRSNKRSTSALWIKRDDALSYGYGNSEIVVGNKKISGQVKRDATQKCELTEEEQNTYAEFIKLLSMFDEDSMTSMLTDALIDAKELRCSNA